MRQLLALLIAAAPVFTPAFARTPAALPAEARSVADRFFTDKRLGETRALLVLIDGRTVYARYAPGYGPGTRLIGWSMTKSVTVTLAGQLVAEGRLALDAPAPVAAWRGAGDPRGSITLRHLLTMTSGLRHQEASAVPEDDDTVRLLFTDRAGDAARAAQGKPLATPPGARFEYSTATSVIVADIVARALAPGVVDPAARRRAMRAALEARLIRPAGMTSLVCEFDAVGTMLGGSLCHATAPDWARFGQMYLDGGVVARRQVVPAAWVALATAPSARNAGYGLHFWLNRPLTPKAADALTPGASDTALFRSQGPADAYAAIGHLGQYVIVAPSKRAVVVRLGRTWDDRLQPVRTALGRLVNSLPNR